MGFCAIIETFHFNQNGVCIFRTGAVVDKTQLQNSCEEFAEMFRLMADNMPDLLWAKDLQQRYLFVNQAVCELLLVANHTHEPIGQSEQFFTQREQSKFPYNSHWHDFAELGQAGQDSDALVITSRKAQRFEQHGHLRGQFTSMDIYKAPLIDCNGNLIGIVGCARVVTHEKSIQTELNLWKKAVDSSHDGIMITDQSNCIIDVNNAFSVITGYRREEALGENPRLLQSNMQSLEFYNEMWEEIIDQGGWQGEIWNQHKEGHLLPMWLTISTLKDSQGIITHYVSVFSDISEVKKKQEKIEFLAYHDSLTLLPNRQFLQDRLTHILGSAARRNEKLAVLFLDLDHFKRVNDSLGHAAGDTLLKTIAERLNRLLRINDIACRLAGDEFVVVLEGIKDSHSVQIIAQKIIDEIAKPVPIAGHKINVAASIGIAVYPDDATEVDTLLKNADTAMYEAKAKGRNGYQFFCPEMDNNALQRLIIEEELAEALINGELEVYYQPQVDMQNSRIKGAEALIRWNHPKYGIQGPGFFIEIAEASHLILEIGRFVLDSVCRQYKIWQSVACDIQKIAVNLSIRQFSDPNLVENLSAVLKKYNLDGHFLEFEITESLLMQKNNSIRDNIEGIKKLGVELVIDDFGTGYSSLSHLRSLPIDVLKIDSSFVKDIGIDSNDEAIVRSIIVLAKAMNMTVIAEGVEIDSQQDFLHDEGCEIAQGYKYAKPMPVNLFDDYYQQKEGVL